MPMKDQLLKLVATVPNKLNVLREYLQSFILFGLQKHKFFHQCVFLGGTCLRFVTDLPRFSEDLDFSLATGGLDSADIGRRLGQELEAAGYQTTVKEHPNKSVVALEISFSGLLFETHVSRDPRKKVMIKVEIDTCPPPGNSTAVTLANKYFPLALKHNDLETLLAGKINALFTRPYTKGRDYFDIFWLLSRNRVSPNLPFLQNALRQMKSNIHAREWKAVLAEKIQNTSWKQIVSDVSPFLEFPGLEESFTPEVLLSLL